MAGQNLRFSTNLRASTPEMNAPMRTHSELLHPDYQYFRDDWQMLRDGISGENSVKKAGKKYLPPISSDSGVSYDEYKDRAVYANMLSRTVSGLVGTVFRRPIRISNASPRAKKNLETVSRYNNDLNIFSKMLSFEVFAMGRVGVLVDRSDDGSGESYFVPYITENILDWEFKIVDGNSVPVYILLREIVDLGPSANISRTEQTYRRLDYGRLAFRFRMLILEDGVYKQKIYKPDETFSVNLNKQPDATVIPQRNGKTLDFIPFYFFGANNNGPDVEKSPVLDIATINFAHYRTSAALEHGRWFTSLPIYYVPLGRNQGQSEYTIGPSVVWETPADTKPGILEYFGTGLGELAKSMVEKEEHISQLGGRIMGIRPSGTTESEQVYKMKQANEMSILLNVTDALSEGLTVVVKWKLFWDDIKANNISIHVNQDFKALSVDSRELRAIALLYQEGILPLQEVFRIFQDSQYISDEVSYAEFERMIRNIANFPNQPDVEAKSEGYSDADARLRKQMNERNADVKEQKIAADERQSRRDFATKNTTQDNNAGDGKTPQFSDVRRLDQAKIK